MARKSAKFAKATLLWRSYAVVEQHKKIMVLSNAAGRTCFVMRQRERGFDIAVMPTVGERVDFGLETDEFELGSTSKNMTASFRLWKALQEIGVGVVAIDNCDGEKLNVRRKIWLYDYFTHTVNSVKRLGGFRVVPENEIEMAEAKVAEAEAILESFSVSWDHEWYDHYRYRHCYYRDGDDDNDDDGKYYCSDSDYDDDDDDYDDGVWWDGYDSEDEFWECNGI